MKNYYEILEVNENASQEVIEKAYKTLAKKYHPDAWSNDDSSFAERKFKEIIEAYEVLSNEDSRKNYDLKIGTNVSLDNKYNTLFTEQEKIKQEIDNMKTKNESDKYINETQDVNRFIKPNISYAKQYINNFKTLIKNEAAKPQEERSRDFKALVLTVIIISFLLILFWKIPFLRNYLFP